LSHQNNSPPSEKQIINLIILMPKKPICIASKTKLLKPIHDSLIYNTKIAKTAEAFGL